MDTYIQWPAVRVVLLFLVLDFSKHHAGGLEISITVTNTSQSDFLEALIFVIKYSHVILHMQYTKIQKIRKSQKACGHGTRNRSMTWSGLS